ncbi:uncharacterized protein LOC131939296 [Physella acuta]|uniref:uncharacterized protein LOC131939296 n=1 Tax=Physella acuta TaxID=109671 RepID=UPI0027DC54B5|nr:uncharacterized protein LOC131939296 [Physella acuta]XP_059153499.1 uncharacterized protein LOC131939296 [Physella acuta]
MDYFTTELLKFLCVLVALFLIMAGHVKKKRWLFLITLIVTIIALNNYQLVGHVVQTQTLLQAGLDLVHSIFTLVSLHLTFPSRVKAGLCSVLLFLFVWVLYVCSSSNHVLNIGCFSKVMTKMLRKLQDVSSSQKNIQLSDIGRKLTMHEVRVKGYKNKLPWKLSKAERLRLKLNPIIAAASRDVIAYPATPLYHDYESRLATFNSHNFRAWGVSGLPLASAGFYYKKRRDVIRCYRCMREIGRHEYTGQRNLHDEDCPIKDRLPNTENIPTLFRR